MKVEVRCKKCNKLLGKFDGEGEVKCTRIDCGALNLFNTKTNYQEIVKYQNTNVSMKDRATSSGHTFR